jgi:hypothetical protein
MILHIRARKIAVSVRLITKYSGSSMREKSMINEIGCLNLPVPLMRHKELNLADGTRCIEILCKLYRACEPKFCGHGLNWELKLIVQVHCLRWS